MCCDHRHHPHIIRWLKSDAVVNKKSEAGTTAITAVFHGRDVYVANVGDSRAVLVHRDGTATPLSTDHRPVNNESECHRVNKSPLGNN